MALSTRIEVTDSVRPALRSFRSVFAHANREGAQAAGKIMRDSMRRAISGSTTPYKIGERTGRTKRSIRYRTFKVKGGWGAVAGPDNAKSAMILRTHDRGVVTQPHIIRPRSARVLSWVGPDGVRRFAKQVNHPGSRIPRRPIRKPTIKMSKAPLAMVMRGKYKAALREAARRGKAHPIRLSYSQARFGKGGGLPRQVVQHSPEAEAAAAQLASLLGQGG